MNLKKDKGFTLIELIIAIAIITIVIFIGYKIINKSSVFSQEQNRINNVQLGFNNLRKYMTEDLKQSKEFKSPIEEDMNSDYKYEIIKGTESIEYKVDYENRGNNSLYTIKRVDNKGEMSFIENQPVKKLSVGGNSSKPPLVINYNDDSKIYNIQLDYGKSDSELYTFDIYKGDVLLAGNIETPDGGNQIKEENYISYCLVTAKKYLSDAASKLTGSAKKDLENRIGQLNEIIPLSKKQPISDNEYNKIMSTIDELLIHYSKNKPKDRVIADDMNFVESYLEAAKYTLALESMPKYNLTSDSIWNVKNGLVNNIKIHDFEYTKINLQNLWEKYEEQRQYIKKDDILKKITSNYDYLYIDMSGKLSLFAGEERFGLLNIKIQQIYNALRENIDTEILLNDTSDWINIFIDELIVFQIDIQRFVREEVPVDKNNSENNSSSKVPQNIINIMRLKGYNITGSNAEENYTNQKIIGHIELAIQHLIELKYNINRTNYYSNR